MSDHGKEYKEWVLIPTIHRLNRELTALVAENEAMRNDAQLLQRRLLVDVRIDDVKISAGCKLSVVLLALSQDRWSEPTIDPTSEGK